MSVYNNHLIGQEELFNRFEQHSIDLSESAKSVFQYLVRFGLRYLHVDVSQSRIANDLRLTRETVNRAIKHLVKTKFIASEYRYKKTSHYYLSPFFRNEANRARLRYIFKQFKAYLSRRLLLSKVNPHRKESNVTLIRELVNNIYIPVVVSSSNRVTYNVESSEHPVGYVFGTPTRTFIKKEKKNMNEAIVTPAIRRATTMLNLSKWGQMKLMALPDEAIEYALNNINHLKGMNRDLFSAVVNAAVDYCKAQNIQTSWRKFYHLQEVYKMPKNAQFVLSHAPAPSTPKEQWKPREVPQETPQDIIRIWEQFASQPGINHLRSKTCVVSPYLARLIIDEIIPKQEIERLYAQFSFLKEDLYRYYADYVKEPETLLDPVVEQVPIPKDPTKDIMQRLSTQAMEKNQVWLEGHAKKEMSHETNELPSIRMPNPARQGSLFPQERLRLSEADETDMWLRATKTAQ